MLDSVGWSVCLCFPIHTLSLSLEIFLVAERWLKLQMKCQMLTCGYTHHVTATTLHVLSELSGRWMRNKQPETRAYTFLMDCWLESLNYQVKIKLTSAFVWTCAVADWSHVDRIILVNEHILFNLILLSINFYWKIFKYKIKNILSRFTVAHTLVRNER